MDADLLESLSEKLYCGRPSSYHYTKALAESLVLHNAQNLKKKFNKDYKTAIIRPSIVTPTVREPTPGWTNNYYGPTGYLVVCGKGVLRSMIVHKDKICDIVPVDMVANTAITAACYIVKQQDTSLQNQQIASNPDLHQEIHQKIEQESKLNGDVISNGHLVVDAEKLKQKLQNGKLKANGNFSSDEDAESTDKKIINGHLTNGKLSNGHTNGHLTNGHQTNGHLGNGELKSEKLTNGKLHNESDEDSQTESEKSISSPTKFNGLSKTPSTSSRGSLNGSFASKHKDLMNESTFNVDQYLTVFNCVSGTSNPISWGEIHSLCEPFLLKYPSIELFRYPGALLHSNKMLHQIILQLEHNIPAMLIDFIFKLLGHKPM